MYVYIDESGDTGYTKKSTKYFILTAVIVEDPFMLRRIAKSVYKYNLNTKKLNMLHAHQESRSVRNKLLKKLVKEEIRCMGVVFDKRKIYSKDLYIFALETMLLYLKNQVLHTIVVARKDTRKSYNQNIINLFKDRNINFIFSTPTNEKCLQIADYYCWVLFSNYEHNRSDYFNKLKHQIIINAIEDGWTVTKKNNTYVFKKRLGDIKEYSSPQYLNNFIKKYR